MNCTSRPAPTAHTATPGRPASSAHTASRAWPASSARPASPARPGSPALPGSSAQPAFPARPASPAGNHRWLVRLCSATLALLGMWSLPASAVAQSGADDPDIRVGVLELSLGGRLQTQINTSSIDGVPPSQMLIRRARIEIDVRVNDHVSGAIQPDFGGGEVELKDAKVELHLSPALRVLAGRAHRPFGLLEQTSSKRMLPVERGLRIRGLEAGDEYSLLNNLDYSDRDIGLQVSGTPEGLPLEASYAVGWLRGPLHGAVGSQDSYQFAGRVTLRPADDLRIGAGWSSRHFALGTGEQPVLERGHAFEIDLEYGSFAPGLHILAEVSRGDLDPFADATFRGAHAWLGYRTAPLNEVVTGVEPLLRVSVAETDVGVGGPVPPGGILLTPGVNIYFGPLNRVMLNFDLWRGADGSRDAQSFKAMFQLGF